MSECGAGCGPQSLLQHSLIVLDIQGDSGQGREFLGDKRLRRVAPLIRLVNRNTEKSPGASPGARTGPLGLRILSGLQLCPSGTLGETVVVWEAGML